MPRQKNTERNNEAVWIEKRKRWQINVQKDGERKTFTSSIPEIKGKITAEKQADKWLAESKLLTKDTRLQILWDKFIEEMKIVSPEGWRLLETNGKTWILPRLKTRKISTLTPQDWQDCINDAYKSGRAKKTLKNIRGAITRFFAYLEKNSINSQCPRNLTIPKNAPQKTKTIMQPTDINTLFSQSTIIKHGKEQEDFFIYAYRFFIVTGIRRGELVGLKKKEDIIDNVLTINRAVNEFMHITEGKNSNARRSMVLTKQALQILADQENMLKRLGIISPWVFPDESGDLLDPKHLSNKWVTYKKQHNINSTVHELRHTMISIAKADVPEQLLKQMVGHSGSMDTFGIYGHEVSGEKERAAKLLEGVLSKMIK